MTPDLAAVVAKVPFPPEVMERFWSHTKREPNGCLVWTGSTSGTGYGRFNGTGSQVRRTRSAHRFAYEAVVGPIPEGLDLDHLCRNRLCVEPTHLEPVTERENVLRGIGPTALNARKTHCPQGHPYDDANTKVINGSRYCRACRSARSRARRLREVSQ